MHDNQTYPKTTWTTTNQDWKLNLSESALLSSARKVWRKDWIKLIYSSSLSPEEILHDKREVEDGKKQMGGNDYFFQIKDMEASESAAVPDPGKDDIDPESLKRWEDEETLDSTRHLFITGEDGDRPIAKGQDGEQDTNDDEDNASNADSSILQAPKSQTPLPLVLPPS